VDLNGAVVLRRVGEEEPAVISISLFAVIDVGLVVGLRKFVLHLHYFKSEVGAFFLTRVFLVTSTKCSALDAIPVRKNTGEYFKSCKRSITNKPVV